MLIVIGCSVLLCVFFMCSPHLLITGLDVHFIRVRSPSLPEGCRVRALMMVHGWPGSFFEFYKILPLLTEQEDGLAFEVICPSIPGYGFSEAPNRQGKKQQRNNVLCRLQFLARGLRGVRETEFLYFSGFNSLDAARIFLKLMERLGFTEFYLQGGDWGSLITSNMAQMKPE